MTYTVKRLDAGRWLVLSPFGDQLDVKKSKGAAVSLASLLAGWRGKVVVL